MDDEWLTYKQAADLLGCHISRFGKLIERGEIKTRKQLTGRQSRFGSVRRSDVEEIAAADAQRASELAASKAEVERRRHPPDTEHEWIDIAEAARQLGRTEKAVLARIHRERLPATRVGVRWWIRQDQLIVTEAGRLGSKTKRI